MKEALAEVIHELKKKTNAGPPRKAAGMFFMWFPMNI
jgi:hypothetical protein